MILTSKVRWIYSSEHSSSDLPVTTPALFTKIDTFKDKAIIARICIQYLEAAYFPDFFFH